MTISATLLKQTTKKMHLMADSAFLRIPTSRWREGKGALTQVREKERTQENRKEWGNREKVEEKEK